MRKSLTLHEVEEAERRLADNQRQIDSIAFSLYGNDGENRRMMEAGAGAANESDGDDDDSEEE